MNYYCSLSTISYNSKKINEISSLKYVCKLFYIKGLIGNIPSTYTL